MILLKLDEVIMVHMVAVIICSSSNNIVSFWSLQEAKSSVSASSEYLIRTLKSCFRKLTMFHQKNYYC